MTDPLPGSGALPVRRSRLVETDRLTAVVVDVDATGEPEALFVLQAGLHEPPDGLRLVYGYDVAVAGLGAWVADRRVRVTIRPAWVDGDGRISEGHPAGPEEDVLVIDFTVDADRQALEDLARVGRLVVAGPDAGPVPLVVDLDRDLLRRTIDAATA